MAQTESYTLSFRLPDAAAGDRPRYAGMNVERPLSLAAIGRFESIMLHALHSRASGRAAGLLQGKLRMSGLILTLGYAGDGRPTATGHARLCCAPTYHLGARRKLDKSDFLNR